MATNVMAQVYETLLCTPGMNEVVKIDVKVNRKIVLLISHVIERGLDQKNNDEQGLLGLIPEDTIGELRQFAEECLGKAGLKELSEKMKGLRNPK